VVPASRSSSIEKLKRIGESIAVALDKVLLVITPRRNSTRDRKFRKAVDKVNRRYAGLFKRLSE